MTVVRLREKSDTIQLTPRETLEEVLAGPFEIDEILILLYNKKDNCYEFWQGGGVTLESLLWHVKKFEKSLLD